LQNCGRTFPFSICN